MSEADDRSTALITGAGSGIGRAVAVALASRGMRVVLAGRRAALLEETSAMVTRVGGAALAHACDLANRDAVNSLARVAIEAGAGKLAVLVHSAGRHAMSPFEQTSIAELDALLETNVVAPFALTRALLPALRAARGYVVFINSSVSLSAVANLAAYAASKAALKSLADSLRLEVNKDDVRVLSVYPGRTASPMQAEVCRLEGRSYQPETLLQPEDAAASIVTAISMPPTAETIDLHIRAAKR